MSHSNNQISFWTAILININIMVGAAIYINPPLMTASIGGSSYLTWLFGGLVFLPVVMGIARISSLFPGEGSFFNYAQEGLGKSWGFLTGWLYFLSYCGVAAVQESALRHILVQKFHVEWIAHYPHLFDLVFFSVLAYLSCLRLNVVGSLLNVLTLLKLAPLVIVCVLPLFLSLPSQPGLTFTPLDDPYFGLHSLTITLPFAIFGFWGFEACSNLSHRIKNGKASLAILCGFLATSAIYALFHFNLMSIMGIETLSQKGIEDFAHFLPIESQFFISNFSAFIAMAIICAYAVAIYGELTACSFLLHALAKEKMLCFHERLEKLNKAEQPYMAIATMAGIGFLFNLVIPKLAVMLALTNIGFVFAFFATLLSLRIILKRKNQSTLLVPFGLFSSTLVAVYCFRALDSYWDLILPLMAIFLGIALYQFSDAKKKESK